MTTELVSTEPATGKEIWRGQAGNVDETIERARKALRQWSREPLGRRIEFVRRFANEVRKHGDAFAELIARETGKPLLLVPADWTPRPPAFAHIAVALSDTPVTDDAIQGAMPWLRAADTVTAIRIDAEQDHALTLADRLQEMGIDAQLRVVAPSGHDRGAQIVKEAEAIGADMLVAGAYRHSQLVEWLLGSTTRQMLRNTALPLFLAH